MAKSLSVTMVVAAVLLSQPQQPAPLPPPPVDGRMAADALGKGLHDYLDGLAGQGRFGGVVLVARDGRVLYERAYGFADRERGTPLEPSTRFNIASIGKAFTKVAIGQLLSQGRLSLGDTIGTKLPDYPNAEARGATIEQLLGHTAGVADFFGPRFDATPKDQFRSNADYFRFVAPQPLAFPPGTRRQYCNGCYIVLGEIIAAISGMPYEKYIETHVFARAGMATAGFASYGDPGVAMGYTGRGGGPLRATIGMHGRRGSAAGGAFATAADLLSFDNGLRERRLLDSKMTGWYLDSAPVPSGRSPGAYGIAGGAPGANCIVEADGSWTVIVMGNLDPPNAGRVGMAIYRALR